MTNEELTAHYDELSARYYEPWRFSFSRVGLWRYGTGVWCLKLGPLSLYIYSHGVGWTWLNGRGHELRWKAL